MFRSFRFQLFALNLGLILLGVGMLAWWANRQLTETIQTNYGQQIENNAYLIADRFFVEESEYLPNITSAELQQSASTLNLSIALYNVNGQLIQSTHEQPSPLLADDGWVTQGSQYIGRASLTGEDGTIAYIQTEADDTVPQEQIRNQQRIFTIGFGLFALLDLLVTIWLLNNLLKPLAHLKQKAIDIGNGALEQRVQLLPNNEIGEVGKTFNRMVEQINLLIDEQREFASNASHELRTPLTTVRLRVEALQRGNLSSEQETQYLQEVETEMERLGRLVDDLLLLSRIEAKRLPKGEERIDLNRLLAQQLRVHQPSAEKKQLTLQLHPFPQEMLMEASLSHLKLVFRNLIENSIKYTPSGGMIEVSVSQIGEDAIVVVNDNGQGISAEDLPHIGSRFYRADKARNRAIAGVGLGLSLVCSIVKLYGGTVTILSDGEGMGTAVRVAWPLPQQPSDPDDFF